MTEENINQEFRLNTHETRNFVEEIKQNEMMSNKYK